MAIIFGSARNGENGAHGNKPGDQSGGEVSTQDFYMHSKGWYGYRAKNVTYANNLATAMQQACDNNHIGYDQDDRDTLLTQYKKVGSIKSITTDCECDCSSLVRVCIYQATGTLLSDFDTSGEPSVLASSGLFDKVTVNSSADVYNGDILVTKTKGHTGIIVSGRARSSSSGTSSTGSGTSSGTTSGTTSSDDDNYTYTDELKVDGEIGPNTVKRLQTVMGQKGKKNVDGFIDGQQAASKQYWTSITSKACSWTGGSSPVVKKIQQFVINKGFSCGSAGADGKLGKNTAIGIQKFLISLGFSCGSAGADGKFGKNSAMALQNWLNTK